MTVSSCLRLLVLLVLCAGAVSCSKTADKPDGRKLQVVVTLFPLYDFARQVGGDKVEIRLLLPPGLEPHSFEPKPEDMMRIHKADVFVFTNRFMEPWAATLLKGVRGDKLKVVDAGEGIDLMSHSEPDEHSHTAGNAHSAEKDPHVWLSIRNALKMVDTIAAGMIQQDPPNREYYLRNSAAYKEQLGRLDARFREGLASCGTKILMHGGHYAFGYLAREYGLEYRSAYAVSANSEPSPRKLVDLVKKMKLDRVHAIFYEELMSPAMAQMIARETGAVLVKLHGVHNVGKVELEQGVTYLSLMEQNLESLRKGLECR